MVGEVRSGRPQAAVQYVYAENSYEPLARVDSLGSHADVYWYHTEINGLPDALTDKDGKHIWQGRFTIWGSSRGEYHHQVRQGKIMKSTFFVHFL